MFDSLKKFAVEHWLRHYRDPSSWAGVVVLILGYLHIQNSPELVVLLEGVLANAIGVLLMWMDGRINPAIDPTTGRIPPRVQSGPPDTAGVASKRPDVPAGDSTTVRKADELTDAPGFNGNGAN